MVSGNYDDLRLWANQPWNPPNDGQSAGSSWYFAANNATNTSVLAYQGFVTCVD